MNDFSLEDVEKNVCARLRQTGLDLNLLQWNTLVALLRRRMGTRRMKTLLLTLGTVEETVTFLLWWSTTV